MMNTLKVTAWVAVVGTIAISLSGCTKQVRVQQLLDSRKCPGCDLSGANLNQLDLQGVNLEGANLQGASLRGASLGGANLQRANLQNTNLQDADLGCTAFRFNLNAVTQGSNVTLNAEAIPEEVEPGNPRFGLNFNANEKGASLHLNLGGCVDLREANLQGATMPDGSIYR